MHLEVETSFVGAFVNLVPCRERTDVELFESHDLSPTDWVLADRIMLGLPHHPKGQRATKIAGAIAGLADGPFCLEMARNRLGCLGTKPRTEWQFLPFCRWFEMFSEEQMVPEELSGAPPKRLISQSNQGLEKSPRTSIARSGFLEKAGREWTGRFESSWVSAGWGFVRNMSANFGQIAGSYGD